MAKDYTEESTEGFEFPNTDKGDESFFEKIFKGKKKKENRVDWGGGTA